MKNARTTAAFGLLIALALAVGLATRKELPDSPVPSVENPGPLGIRALYLYLHEGKRPVEIHTASLESIPPTTRTVVLTAPEERSVSKAEVASLEDFVKNGGTLVYLSTRELGQRQAELEDWLKLESGPLAPASGEGLLGNLEDAGGTTLDVWVPAGPLRGLSALRVSRARGVKLAHPDAVPLAGLGDTVMLWRWAPPGKGEVYVLAGADLAENRRLELLDNLRFWDALAARGPLLFDESHHQIAPPPPMAKGFWLFAAQVLVVGLLYTASRGSRFGAPRPLRVERHRSALEYVRSMGWLMRRSKVERELLPELDHGLRQQMQERLGIPLGLGDEDAARLLEQGCGAPASEYLDAKAELARLQAQPTIRPSDYARTARRFARLEQTVTGRLSFTRAAS